MEDLKTCVASGEQAPEVPFVTEDKGIIPQPKMRPQRSGVADVSHVLQKEAVLLVCGLEKESLGGPGWRVLLL